jgi:2,3-bisphosphoglycerate-independent phosphoglycerate mutase
VARLNILVSNSFSALRIIAEDPARGQRRQVWEVSSRKPQQSQKKHVSTVTLKERRNLKTRKSRCQISDQTQNRVLVKPRSILPSQNQVSQNWRSRASQVVRLVKGRNQKTVQERIPITSKTQYESQLKPVAEEHISYRVFNRLGPKIRSENFAISVNKKKRKKR